MAAKKDNLSEDTKTLITVLLLVFAYPVGLVMMFVWTKWPGWVKTLIVLPLVLGILFFFLIGGLVFSAIIRGGPREMKNRDYNYTFRSSGAEDSSSSGRYMMEK